MKTKQCFKCKRRKPLAQFYKHPQMRDGHLNKCKHCTKKDVAKNYLDNFDHYQGYERKRFRTDHRKKKVAKYREKRVAKFPGKAKARHKFENAVRNGKIKRLPCEVCGDPKSQGHHTDYRKPLDVKWLCFIHHRKAHGQLKHLD